MCWQTTFTSAKSCSSNTAETSNTSLLLLLPLLLSIQDTPSHLCALFPPLQDHLTPSFLSSSLRVAAREESVVESAEDSPITKVRNCHDTTKLRISGRLIQNES